MEGDAAEGFGGLLLLGLDVGDVVVLWFEMGGCDLGKGVFGLFSCGWEGVWWLCEGHCTCVSGPLISKREL